MMLMSLSVSQLRPRITTNAESVTKEVSEINRMERVAIIYECP